MRGRMQRRLAAGDGLGFRAVRFPIDVREGIAVAQDGATGEIELGIEGARVSDIRPRHPRVWVLAWVVKFSALGEKSVVFTERIHRSIAFRTGVHVHQPEQAPWNLPPSLPLRARSGFFLITRVCGRWERKATPMKEPRGRIRTGRITPESKSVSLAGPWGVLIFNETKCPPVSGQTTVMRYLFSS